MKLKIKSNFRIFISETKKRKVVIEPHYYLTFHYRNHLIFKSGLVHWF